MSAEPIYFSNVRLSFPSLVEPQRSTTVGKENEVTYSATFLIPKDHPSLKAFSDAYGRLALEKWKDQAPNILNFIMPNNRLRCFGAGEEKIYSKTGKPYEGYEGVVYIAASRKYPPQVYHPNGQEVNPSDTMAYQAVTKKMYPGCMVNVALKPWLQENQHGRGIRCDLSGIQFFADNTPFGEAAIDSSSLFGAVDNSPTEMPAPPFGMPGMPSFLS